MSTNRSTEVTAEVRSQIEEQYDKISELPFGQRFKENKAKNIETLCNLYGAEAPDMLKLALKSPESFYDACGNGKNASEYSFKRNRREMYPKDALDTMLHPERYERNGSAEELVTSLESSLGQMKASMVYEKPNVTIDSPVTDRSGEIPEDKRKEYLNNVADEYLKIVNAGSYEDKDDLHTKKDAMEVAQDLCKNYGSDALNLVKLAHHHPEEFQDACGAVNVNGWERPKDRMDITPEDALSCLRNPSFHERNNSPAQLCACLQESINDPQKIADQSYTPETKKEVQSVINHIDDVMSAQVVKEGKELGQQLCELYGDKAGVVAAAYLDSLAKDGDVEKDDLLSDPRSVAEELKLEGDPEKNAALYEKYDSETKQPYEQGTLDSVSNKIANFYEKHAETAKFSKETAGYLCETYGDKAPQILNEVINYPQSTVRAFGYRSPEDVTIADQIDRLCYDNPHVGDKVMSSARARQFSAEYLSFNNDSVALNSHENAPEVAKTVDPADKDRGIVDVNEGDRARPTLNNLTAENLTDPTKITNPREWEESLRESTSRSFKNQVTLVALANSTQTNSEVSTATDAFNSRVDERMPKEDQSKDIPQNNPQVVLAANVEKNER